MLLPGIGRWWLLPGTGSLLVSSLVWLWAARLLLPLSCVLGGGRCLVCCLVWVRCSRPVLAFLVVCRSTGSMLAVLSVLVVVLRRPYRLLPLELFLGRLQPGSTPSPSAFFWTQPPASPCRVWLRCPSVCPVGSVVLPCRLSLVPDWPCAGLVRAGRWLVAVRCRWPPLSRCYRRLLWSLCLVRRGGCCDLEELRLPSSVRVAPASLVLFVVGCPGVPVRNSFGSLRCRQWMCGPCSFREL